MENKRLRWVLTSYQVLELRTTPRAFAFCAFSVDVLMDPDVFRKFSDRAALGVWEREL